MSLQTEIRNLLTNLLPPARTRVIIRGSQQPPALAHTLDVDAIHGILRSAEQGETTRLFALYRDIVVGHAHTQGEFSKRKLAVLGEPITLIPHDPEDPTAAAHCQAVQNHLTSQPAWINWLAHNLDSTLYPVALSIRTYQPSYLPGWRYQLNTLQHIPHIHLTWPDGILSIRETDDDGRFTSAHYTPDPRTHIIHRGHLLTSVPDWWGGPMRAIVFWWLFATMDRDWWARYLDRYGAPFLVGRYPEADDGARWSLQDAFSAATRLFGLVVSNETQIEMHQANSAAAGDAFEKFHHVANREISKLILGQTSSAEIQTSGLGDSQGAAQAAVRDDIRKFDAVMLAHTVRTQILAPLWSVNGWTIPLPNVSFGAVAIEEAAVNGALVSSLAQAGLIPTDDGIEVLSKRVGFNLQRAPQPALPLALSATPAPHVTRAARQQQARRAVAAMIATATPPLARIMRTQALALAAAIETAETPIDAASAVAALAASYDPALATDLIAATLAATSANAVLALD
jgi:phage gp29-like protein